MAIQALDNPVKYIAPGKPISSQPLISAAPAESAVTAAPNFLPPMRKSSELEDDFL